MNGSHSKYDAAPVSEAAPTDEDELATYVELYIRPSNARCFVLAVYLATACLLLAAASVAITHTSRARDEETCVRTSPAQAAAARARRVVVFVRATPPAQAMERLYLFCLLCGCRETETVYLCITNRVRNGVAARPAAARAAAMPG